MKKFIKEIETSLKEIKENGDNTFEVIVSTDDVDRVGDSLKQDGIDFKDYLKAPVVLVDHKYTVENIIGKTTDIRVEGGQTIAKGVFSQTNPKAKLVQDLYNEGMLKTVSIGFIPLETENDRENDQYNITKSSMLEFSFVAIPCNPNALSKRGLELYKKGLEAGMLKEVTEEVKVEEEESIETKILKELQALKSDILEIKTTIADDKASKSLIEEGIENKKELQEANNTISKALSLIKLASK